VNDGLRLGQDSKEDAGGLARLPGWRQSGISSPLMDEAAGRVPGGVLMIADAHAWYDLPGHGQQMICTIQSA
jgi:hypothetical protein